MLLTSYHNHSVWSDGQNSIAEMYQAAKAAGLREFGLSDHWIIPPEVGYDHESWSLHKDRLEEYVEECLFWKKRLDDENFTIKLGLEVDFFAENYQENLQYLQKFPFDYLIAAVHFYKKFSIDHQISDWLELNQEQIDQIWLGYCDSLCQLAATSSFDFLAHIDLPKKFAFYPSTSIETVLKPVLEALQKYDLPIEINTAGWSKDCAEAYPGMAIVKKAKELGIPILVNADAHCTADLKQHYDKAEKMLLEAGITEVCRFENRKRTLHKI